MWRRFPTVRQHDRWDCGAACLSAVARYYGLRVPLAVVRQFAGTDREGTSILGLKEAAVRIGFHASGVRSSQESLNRLVSPAVAHLGLANGADHFVVVCSTNGKSVRIMDPAVGRVITMPREEFLHLWTGTLLLLAPASPLEEGLNVPSARQRILSLLRPHRRVLLQALLGALLYTILGLSTAIYVQKIVDNVLPDGNGRLLNILSLFMVGLLVIQVYLGAARGVLMLRTGQCIDATLILGYYGHLLHLPQRFFDSMRVGEIISRVGDAVKIRAFINDIALDLVVNLLIVVLSLGMMLAYDWRIGAAVTLCIPLFGLVFAVANGMNRKVLRRAMEEGAELESELVGSITAIATVKRFGLEGGAASRIERRLVRLLRPLYDAGLSAIMALAATDAVARAAIIVVLWAGSMLVLRNSMTPGELMSFFTLVGYFTGPAAKLVGSNRALQEALIAGDRLYEIIDLPIQTHEQKLRVLPDPTTGELLFENVHFRYGSRPPIFVGLNLRLPAGATIGVVGESGSGKSTLMALAEGLYPLSAGRIALDGIDISRIHPDLMRTLISSVPQQIDLLPGNIIDNVAPGEPDPDILRMLRTCDELGLTQLIDELPQGFHTRLDQDGISLSGGQRQRLAIARALYRRPRVLLLDEATSGLDALSEAKVRRALEAFRSEGRTVVIITHRFSSVADADRIVVLEGGRVTGVGTHHELIGRENFYARLWRLQLESNSPESVTTYV
jgi:ATP-binding cassette, subfamily C, bacteriocin exporter